jgi:hypothetical protein
MAKKFFLAAVLACGLAGQASAAEVCYSWEKVTSYECVTTYVCKQIPYNKTVCLYDHCGKPYYATKTFYKTVEVPIVKHVPVAKWVKRYH